MWPKSYRWRQMASSVELRIRQCTLHTGCIYLPSLYPYLVCILFDVPSQHVFTCSMFLFYLFLYFFDENLSYSMLSTLASYWNKYILRQKWKWKGQHSPGIKPRRPGHLACAVSALPLNYDNHTTTNPHNPRLVCTAQVGLKYLSCTPGSHSVCAIRTSLGADWKILFIMRRPMLSGFLNLKA